MTSILISSVIPTGNIASLHRYLVKMLEASLSTAVKKGGLKKMTGRI